MAVPISPTRIGLACDVRIPYRYKVMFLRTSKVNNNKLFVFRQDGLCHSEYPVAWMEFDTLVNYAKDVVRRKTIYI